MRTVSMLQSNYIPWKGVFDLIHRSDVFVFYDDVQFTKKDWRSRNKIPTANGETWLSVPVRTKGRREQLIVDTEIDTADNWQQKHLKTLKLTYSKAPHFKMFEELLFDFYEQRQWSMLCDMNRYMTEYIARILGIEVEYIYAEQLGCAGSKDGEKVLEICKKLGCDRFINGPAAREFMDEEKFKQAGVELVYMDYDYPEYRQLTRGFNHAVSVLDLLFNTGADAPAYIWGGNKGAQNG